MAAEIQTRTQQFCDDINSLKIKQVADLFTDTGILCTPKADVKKGRPAIQVHLEAGAKSLTPKMENLSIVDLEFLGETFASVVMTFDYVLEGKTLGKAKALVVWQKVGANWFIHRYNYNTAF